MWVRSTGRLGETISLLTTPVSSHLLVEGDGAALIDAGSGCAVETLIGELTQFLGGPEALRYICLTHAHFDHVGALDKLRAWAPHVQVVASPLTSDVLDSAQNVAALRAEEDSAREAVGLSATAPEWKEAVVVDRVLGDGDQLELGDGVSLKLFFTPGHSKDSASYYVPEEAALAGGEAIGAYRGRDKCDPAFLSSYKEYFASLDKLSSLEVRALIFSHSGCVTGELVPRFLTTLRVESERFQARVQEQIKGGVLLDEIYAEIHAEWETENIAPDGPFVAMRDLALKQMIDCVRNDR